MKIWGIVFLLMAGFAAMAAPDLGPRFGPEFTFESNNEGDVEVLIEQMVDHLVNGQPEGAKFIRHGDTFHSPNGWKFVVGLDPGVIEIQMNPMTVEDFEKYSGDIQDAIFVSAANRGFYPALFLGGGHINIDAGYFVNKPPLLLRNFLIDYFNHSELSMGIFNYDCFNAVSHSLVDSINVGIARTIERFDKGEFGDIHKPSRVTVTNFLRSLRYVHTTSPLNPERSITSKGCEISLHDFLREDRIEIRAVRPQPSVSVWVRQIKLLRDRIRYLERAHTQPIPIAPSVRAKQLNWSKNIQTEPPINPEAALRGFFSYVTESGHSWEDHRDYIWPKWMFGDPAKPDEPTELEKFELSIWFRVRQCHELLTIRKAA